MSSQNDSPDWKKLAAIAEGDELLSLEARSEKLKELLRKQQAQLPVLEQVAELAARVKFANYQALIKAGFAPEQALLLIK